MTSVAADRASRFLASFSTVGLLSAACFFALSLTPSMLPRSAELQGLVSGVSSAIGYGLGVLAAGLWHYLELPELEGRTARRVKGTVTLVCLCIVAWYLWHASYWQNSVRTLMDLEPVDSVRPLNVGVIAIALFIFLVALARAFRLVYRYASGRLEGIVPRRIAGVLGLAIAAALLVSMVDGIIFRVGLRVADSAYEALDRFRHIDIERPAHPLKTGSEKSLIEWGSLGSSGREFIATGPSREDLSEFTGGDAKRPLRVYVGLRSAETPAARARLALKELIRVGAFERSVLILATPTGTGWLDPAAMRSVEYLHRGDIAIAAVQYSYLSSPLSLIVEPEYGAKAARALFHEVYRHWTRLPDDRRPGLYLYGLSLGALASEQSARLFEVFSDPFQGALWSGPPFPSEIRSSVTRNREPGSPVWLPRFHDSSMIRFTSQENALDIPGAEWGPMRIVYLQYASDPIVFFEPDILYRKPEWLKGERGPDVSDDLSWYPVVTFLQMLVDMVVATQSDLPPGHGHAYHSSHYIDAWLEVTEPPGWTSDEVTRLKERLGNGS